MAAVAAAIAGSVLSQPEEAIACAARYVDHVGRGSLSLSLLPFLVWWRREGSGYAFTIDLALSGSIFYKS